MVKKICGLLLLSLASPVHAVIFTDPVAQAQRATAHAEQMIQSSYLYKTMVETYNNYQAVKLTYDMAKAGYEKARNPEEWKALAEYEKMRLNSLEHPNTDPSQASLFRTVKSLDQAADSYIMNTDVFIKAQVLGKETGSAIGSADQLAGNFLDQNTPLGEWTDVKAAADSKKSEWDMQHDALLAAQLDARDMATHAKKLTSDSFDNAKELEKLKKVEYYAELEYQNANEQAQGKGSVADNKARQVRLDAAHRMVEDIRNRQGELHRKSEQLTREAVDLQRLIEENNNKLGMAAASFGLDGFAAKLMKEANLSRMSDNEVWVKQVSVVAFWLLLIAVSLALLLKGWGALSTNEDLFPHDVVVSLILAFIFITPGSPMHVQKLARTIAIISDTLEMTLYSDALFKTQSSMLSSMGQAATSSFPNVSALPETSTQDQFNAAMNKSAQGPDGLFGATKSLMFSSSAALTAWVFQLGSAFCTYIGVVAVVVTFNLRTLLFWVLVAVSPLLIALAPLRWARHSVIKELGITLYSVLMWGFIARIILVFNNNITLHNLELTSNLSALGSPMQMVRSMVDGFILTAMMILSPLMSYGLARGSFQGVLNTAGAAAGLLTGQAVKQMGTKAVQMASGAGVAMGRAMDRLVAMVGKK